MTNNYMVAVGDPFDGIEFFGPFDNFEDAEWWADNNDKMATHLKNWWIVRLESPN